MTAPVVDETRLGAAVVLNGGHDESLFWASSRPDVSALLWRPSIGGRRCNVVLCVGSRADFDLRPAVPIEVTNAPRPEKPLAGIFETEHRRPEQNAESRFLIRSRRHHMENLRAPVAWPERISVALSEGMTDRDSTLWGVREELAVAVYEIGTLEDRNDEAVPVEQAEWTSSVLAVWRPFNLIPGFAEYEVQRRAGRLWRGDDIAHRETFVSVWQAPMMQA